MTLRRAAILSALTLLYASASFAIGCGDENPPPKPAKSPEPSTQVSTESPKARPSGPDSSAPDEVLPPLPAPNADAKPLRLLLSGMMDGHLEPCGCASAQAGGVDRRAFWLKLNKHRYDLKLEGGNSIAASNPLERQKMQWIQTILFDLLGYGVFPLGPRDLALGSEELSLYADPETGAPFLCSDLLVKDKPAFPVFAIRAAGDYKVCLVSLAGVGAKAFSEDARIVPAKDAITAALAKAGKRGTDFDCVVLFANDGGPEVARQHARTIPGVDLVLSWDRQLETRSKAETFRRDPAEAVVAQTTLLYPGWRGKNLMLWQGKPDEDGNWHTISIDKEVLQVPSDAVKGKRPSGSDEEVWSMLIASKQEIGELGLREQMAEREKLPAGMAYAGNSTCNDCHASAYEAWKASRHSHAWETLEKRSKLDGWPVAKHPDCVRCHSVGYGKVTGFVNPERTPDLADVGCEACHGPAQKHVEIMKEIAKREVDSGAKASREELDRALLGGKLRKANASGCVECHDFDQSPGFDFVERWPKIQHGLDR